MRNVVTKLLLNCLFVIASFATCPAEEAPEIDRLNKDGFSQLHYAAMHGDTATLQKLLNDGANVEIQQGKFKGRPLQYAAAYGRLEATQALLEAKASIDSTDSFGRTPLMWAAQNGHAEIIKLLIEHEANINAKTRTGWTALAYARKAQKTSIIEQLESLNASERTVTPQAHVSPRKSAIAPLLPPKPFLSRSGKKEIQWDDVTRSDLDIAIHMVGPTVLKDGKLALSIRLVNKSDRKIRTNLASEWHGGEWPPTDLYARVWRVGDVYNREFRPAYLLGSRSAEPTKTTSRRVKPDETVKAEIRLDWPGTGSVPAEPLIKIDQYRTYHVQLLLVFRTNKKNHYVMTPEVPIAHTDGVPRLLKHAIAPAKVLDANEPVKQRDSFSQQRDILRIPDEQLPANVQFEQSSVYLPKGTKRNVAAFQMHMSFLRLTDSLPKPQAVITAIYEDKESGVGREIGVFAYQFSTEDEAKTVSAAHPNLIQKRKLLLYVWKDAVRQEAFDQIEMYFKDTQFSRSQEPITREQ